MSEQQSLLADAAERLFGETLTKDLRHRAEAGEFPQVLWQALSDSGLLHPARSETEGGAGGDAREEYVILRAAGHHAAPGPLAETMLAGWLFASAGRAIPSGPLAVGPVNFTDSLRLHRAGANWKLDGEVKAIAWARQAAAIALLAEGPEGPILVELSPGGIRGEAGANMAGEPRETLSFRNYSLAGKFASPLPAGITRIRLIERGAAMRSALMAGALQALLERAVRYAGERVQFGRNIGKFQAVQQELAKLAGQVAAAGAASEAAFIALASGKEAQPLIAAAKARVGEAAGLGAAIAHQVHGAIGFTHEHDLHFFTRRLWAWRDEYGNEARWQMQLGRAAAAAGGDGLWPFVTAL